MKYLFLGLLFDKAKEKEYLEKSNIGLQNAINIFQWNLIDGMLENHADIDIINVLPVGCYPKQYSEAVLHSKAWEYKGARCFECGCINIPFFKQMSRKIKIYRQVKKWIKENKDEEKAIIAYSYYLPFLQALAKVKRNKKAITSLIVPDLPSHFGILPKNRIKAYILNSYGKKVLKYSKLVDKFVFFTKHMPVALGLENKSHIIIEGICPTDLKGNNILDSSEKKVIFYSGTLNRKFGIDTLLEAFSQIDGKDFELWICGSGEAENDVKEYAKRDNRIVFWGYCSFDKVNELRSRATVLVNPRPNNEEFTKYSFPSKTMEYMLSGIPVVMYKLDGIPNEYDSYLFYVKESGAKPLGEMLEAVCKMTYSDRKAFGTGARNFVISEKNSKEQAKKFLQLLQGRSNM